MSGKVKVFVAGAQKCGTTALHAYLRDHPDMSAADVKETHFFDDETGVDWNDPDYRRLEARYPEGDDGRLRFDSTPIYLFWEPSLERVRRYNPEAKVILLFRDPAERAWSQWRMEYARGKENLPFSAAIREGRERLQGVDRLDRRWRYYSYVERGLYGCQMDRLIHSFPRDQVLLLRSQDLGLNTAGTLAEVAHFLGISPFSDQRTRIVLPAKTTQTTSPPPTADMDHLRGLFQEDLRRFADTWPIDVSGWQCMSGGEPVVGSIG